MKYYKRLKVYKTSNNLYDPEKREAWSFDWWQYVREINGIIVFNDYNYSISTSKHQHETWIQLQKFEKIEDLSDDPRFIVVKTRASLAGPLPNVRALIVEPIVYEIEKLKAELSRPRLNERGIKSRLDRINELKRELTVLRKRLKCVTPKTMWAEQRERAEHKEANDRKAHEDALEKKRKEAAWKRVFLKAELGNADAEKELMEMTA